MYARKIKYAADIDGFLALMEIVKKKGKEPKYVLYRFSVSVRKINPKESGFAMIEFGSKDNALLAFSINAPFYFRFHSEAFRVFDPWRNREGYEKLWQKTNHWLFKAAVGSGYEINPRIIPLREWVKVGRPNLR